MIIKEEELEEGLGDVKPVVHFQAEGVRFPTAGVQRRSV